jgi:hypothetical protein
MRWPTSAGYAVACSGQERYLLLFDDANDSFRLPPRSCGRVLGSDSLARESLGRS